MVNQAIKMVFLYRISLVTYCLFSRLMLLIRTFYNNGNIPEFALSFMVATSSHFSLEHLKWALGYGEAEFFIHFTLIHLNLAACGQWLLY